MDFEIGEIKCIGREEWSYKRCVFYQTVPLFGRYCKDNEFLDPVYPCILFTRIKENDKLKGGSK